VSVRDNGLYSFTRQHKIETPTNITGEIAEEALRIFRADYHWENPIRSIGVRACDLCDPQSPVQLSFFQDENYRERLRRADRATDDVRKRFGSHVLRPGAVPYGCKERPYHPPAWLHGTRQPDRSG
jgi:DNA polymerase-4